MANSQQPPSRIQFADTFDNSYITFGDIYAYIENFHHQGNYELEAAKYAYSITQPSSAPGFASAQQLNLFAPGFKGKVMLTTGEFDYALCNGNCTAVYAEKVYEDAYPKAGVIYPYLLPGAGHGINLEKDAKIFYAEITKFLASA